MYITFGIKKKIQKKTNLAYEDLPPDSLKLSILILSQEFYFIFQNIWRPQFPLET